MVSSGWLTFHFPRENLSKKCSVFLPFLCWETWAPFNQTGLFLLASIPTGRVLIFSMQLRSTFYNINSWNFRSSFGALLNLFIPVTPDIYEAVSIQFKIKLMKQLKKDLEQKLLILSIQLRSTLRIIYKINSWYFRSRFGTVLNLFIALTPDIYEAVSTQFKLNLRNNWRMIQNKKLRIFSIQLRSTWRMI